MRHQKYKYTAVGWAQGPWVSLRQALSSVRNVATLDLKVPANPQLWPKAISICRGTQKKMKTADRQALALAGSDLLFPIISKMFSFKVTMSPSSAGFDSSLFKKTFHCLPGVLLNKCPKAFLKPNLL